MAKRIKRTDDVTGTDPFPQEDSSRSQAPATTGSHPGVEPKPADDAAEQGPQDGKTWPATPEPFGIQTINLSEETSGPKMRLFRANKFQQMQIQFDEKPDETIRARLNSDGWKWRNVEKVWTKQLDPDARWRTHADAERLFKDIGDAIRAERGLSPTQESAR